MVYNGLIKVYILNENSTENSLKTAPMHPLVSAILPILALLPNVLGFEQRSTTDASIVDLGYAQYQGVFDVSTNTTSFFGIRYAAPPVGQSFLPIIPLSY